MPRIERYITKSLNFPNKQDPIADFTTKFCMLEVYPYWKQWTDLNVNYYFTKFRTHLSFFCGFKVPNYQTKSVQNKEKVVSLIITLSHYPMVQLIFISLTCNEASDGSVQCRTLDMFIIPSTQHPVPCTHLHSSCSSTSKLLLLNQSFYS